MDLIGSFGKRNNARSPSRHPPQQQQQQQQQQQAPLSISSSQYSHDEEDGQMNHSDETERFLSNNNSHMVQVDHHHGHAGSVGSTAAGSALVAGSSSTTNHHHHHHLDTDLKKTLAAQQLPAMSSTISRTGLLVLILLAVQNCSKNLLMRYVMKGQPKFLTSAAVLGSECLKLSLSCIYILCIQRRSLQSIGQFLQADRLNTLLLTVPASAYNLQQSLEYVALAHLDAAMFSVLVQTKLLFTAVFAALVLRKKLKYIQVISLLLLTTGVMLCNMPANDSSSSSSMELVDPEAQQRVLKGIMATLGIAVSSGFASVYTEKVIKGVGSAASAGRSTNLAEEYGLAYTQVQLALMSIVTIGAYACFKDWKAIWEYGLFHNFSSGAVLSIVSSAVGGLIVASVLKYADSVLKGYATAISVILTGVLSMILFGTHLSVIYFMGIINVVTAVLLYNGKDLDQFVCA